MCKTKLNCTYCNKEVEKETWQIKQRQNKGYNNLYCSNQCQAKHKSTLFVNKFKETGLIKCSGCKRDKHYSNFTKNRGRSIGYNNRCKDCRQKEYAQMYTAYQKLNQIKSIIELEKDCETLTVKINETIQSNYSRK